MLAIFDRSHSVGKGDKEGLDLANELARAIPGVARETPLSSLVDWLELRGALVESYPGHHAEHVRVGARADHLSGLRYEPWEHPVLKTPQLWR